MKFLSILVLLCVGSAPIFADDIGCTACKDAVDMLDYLLESPFGKGDLEVLLKQLCAQFPDPYATNCNNTVDGFMDVIIKFITDMTAHICDGACPTASTIPEASNPCTSTCDVLNQAYTNGNPLYKVDAICDRLPGFETQCQEFFKSQPQAVTIFEKGVFKFLLAKLNKMPFNECRECKIESLVATVGNDIECLACQDSIAILDELLKSPLVEQSLKDLLITECKKLPKPSEVITCKLTVNKGINKIIDFLVQETQKACNSVCPSASTPVKQFVKGDTIECQACKDAINLVDTVISSSLAEGELEDLLKQECALLPAPYNKDCAGGVDPIVDSLVKFIEDMAAHSCDGLCKAESAPKLPVA